ncbi:MAG: cation:proton antiporter [Bacillota bacterium]
MDYAAQLGFLVIAGLIGAKFLHRFGLPEVTGYLLMGFLLGPRVLGLIDGPAIAEMHFVEELALGFIAFTIGLELDLAAIKRIETGIVPIALIQSIATVILVTVGVFAISRSLPLSLLLGAMATATSPAEVLLVIRGLGSSGPVTRTCLGVVALDDAIGIILFALLIPVAVLAAGGRLVPGEIIIVPLIEIVGSLLMGLFFGLALARILRRAPSHGFALGASLTSVFLASGLSHLWHTSPLLTCLTLGATVVNSYPYVAELLHSLDEVMAPLHVILFGGIGASLNPAILGAMAPLTLTYTFTRGLGKAVGAGVGAAVTEAPATVGRYLWPTLLPQAGINIGLVALVGTHFPELQEVTGAVILASSAIFTIIGFPMAHFALRKAGEANESIAEHAG